MEQAPPSLILAVGTHDQTTLHDDHVGESRFFMLFKVGAEETQWIETRENLRGEAEKDPAHHHGDPHQAKHVATLLAGVDGIVAKRFGPNIKRMVHKFVCCLVKTDTVAEAVELAQRDLPLLVQHLQQGPDRKAVRLPPSPP